ncbi:MAG: ATP-binding protein [Nocardioidaceae bacterium]
MTDLHAPARLPEDSPEIAISVPASSAYLSVLRTAAAGLAARLDFTIDDIEDLRIAVDEACAILLMHAQPGGLLDCRFDLLDDSIVVTVSIVSGSADVPPHEGFSWTVLSALATAVRMEVRPGTGRGDHRLVIMLTQTGKRVESQ